VEVDKNKKIQKRRDQDPALYADFPLIGSHEFPFPCFINSHIFWPDEERSSIILSYSIYADLNRRLLFRCTKLYNKLLNYLASNPEFSDITSICHLSGAIPINLDKQWYLNNILKENIKTIC
jgi:hypothetical protein